MVVPLMTGIIFGDVDGKKETFKAMLVHPRCTHLFYFCGLMQQ
jgi:hypothetical protein